MVLILHRQHEVANLIVSLGALSDQIISSAVSIVLNFRFLSCILNVLCQVFCFHLIILVFSATQDLWLCIVFHTHCYVDLFEVIVDDTMSFDEQVNSVYKSAYFHLRALRHIQKVISEDTVKTIAGMMIDGRLDYCNGLLYETSAANIHK